MGEGASIINIGSVVSSLTPPNSAVYTGTKGAVDAITGVLAKELGPKKIRVNSINPGMVETEGMHTAGFIGSDFETGARRADPARPSRTAWTTLPASPRSSLRTTPSGSPASWFAPAAASVNQLLYSQA